MRSLSRVLSLFLVLIGGMVLPAAGQLAIDDFTAAQTVSNNTAPSSVVDEISGAGILGGVRLIRLTNGVAGSSSGIVNAGVLTMSTDTESDLEIWWDGVDDDGFTPAGLGGVDLTQGGMFDRFTLDVSTNTLPAEQMRMQIWIDGGNRCEVLFTMPAGTVEVPFSSFTTCNGTATPVTASQNAGLILLRTVLRPGTWSFSLGFLQSTPVELVEFSVE